jgi:Prophage minor tail protein Z (GPZ).
MIVYVPQDVYDRLYTRLKDMPEKIPDTLKKTINNAAKEAEKSLPKEVKKEYVLKDAINRVKKSTSVEKATARRPGATIEIKGGPVPLYDFQRRKNGARTAAKARVLTGSSMKQLILRGGDDNGKDLKAFIQEMENGHIGIFQRLNSEERKKQQKYFDGRDYRKSGYENGERKVKRNAIKQLYSVSMPQMAENKEVSKEVRDIIMEELRNSMEKHIASVMEGL